MPSFNGHVASSTTVGATDIQNADPNVPVQFFSQGKMAIRVIDGVSGSFGVAILSAIGGATFFIGGVTAISAVGNFPIGATQTTSADEGFPGPTKVYFDTIDGAVGGWTASVYIAGEY